VLNLFIIDKNFDKHMYDSVDTYESTIDKNHAASMLRAINNKNNNV
jgi:hypothetical protein